MTVHVGFHAVGVEGGALVVDERDPGGEKLGIGGDGGHFDFPFFFLYNLVVDQFFIY